MARRRSTSIIDDFACEMDDNHQFRRYWPTEEEGGGWYRWKCRLCGAECDSGSPPDATG